MTEISKIQAKNIEFLNSLVTKLHLEEKVKAYSSPYEKVDLADLSNRVAFYLSKLEDSLGSHNVKNVLSGKISVSEIKNLFANSDFEMDKIV